MKTLWYKYCVTGSYRSHISNTKRQMDPNMMADRCFQYTLNRFLSVWSCKRYQDIQFPNFSFPILIHRHLILNWEIVSFGMNQTKKALVVTCSWIHISPFHLSTWYLWQVGVGGIYCDLHILWLGYTARYSYNSP